MNINTQLLSNNADTDGFDLQAGQMWIYPINYPMRDYQFNIVSESLYKNTLVSLPTGLGKTFIAAVVMFNFYRWYPSGKVIFMAPTKPLVKQQMDACYNIMAIPKEATVELTGTKAQLSRTELWINKRVFFVTPQVLQNDLNTIPQLAKQIKCIVIDEAHKARGNHAYCEVIRQLAEFNKHFRVLALSATPGSTINDVSDVINNLLISHMEIRTDESADVIPYIFQRTIEKVVVPLGQKLQEIKSSYLQILEKYTRILFENGVIAGNNCANLTKGRIFMITKEFQAKNKLTKIRNYGDIMRNLNICITLYHGYELLTRHGLRAFLNYFEEHSDKALLRGNTHLHNIMMQVQDYLGPKPSVELLPNGKIPELSPLTKFGHPKFYKLQDILLNYFSDANNKSSKVIVFTEYRDSVMQIFALLIQHTPLIKPKYFLGQSSITQKQQVNAIKSFRSGEYNTLISTCIGEEGLDIGEVDLIVCFDISNKSPIRMIQRIGRTGRKKEGKVIVLVTEGKEEEMFKECIVSKQYLSKNILQSKRLDANFYANNPRMIPENVTPVCQKIYMSVPTVSTTKTKSGNLRDMLNNMGRGTKRGSLPPHLSDIEVTEMQDRIPETSMVWDKGKCINDSDRDINKINFSRRLETLRVSQATNIIGHSTNGVMLTSLLQYADSKRYNIPISQTSSNETTSVGIKKNKLRRHDSSDNYKQSDIRTMFLKSQSTAIKVIHEEENAEHIVHNVRHTYRVNDLSNELHNEISMYLSLTCVEDANCKICDNLFICYRTTKKDSDIKLDNWIQPDFAPVQRLQLEDIINFEKGLNPSVGDINNSDLLAFDDFADENWDEFDEPKDKTNMFGFELPKSAKNVFEATTSHADKTELSNDVPAKIVNRCESVASANDEISTYEHVSSFFKLTSLGDLFNSNPDTTTENVGEQIKSPSNESKLSVEPINFDVSPIIDRMQEQNISPKISALSYNSNHSNFSSSLSTSTNTFDRKQKETTPPNSPTLSLNSNNSYSSPILSSFNRSIRFNVATKNLFTENEEPTTTSNTYIQKRCNKLKETKPKLSNLHKKSSSLYSKSTMSSKCIDEQDFKDEDQTKALNPNISNNYIAKLLKNTEDFCDLSIFGFDVCEASRKDSEKVSQDEVIEIIKDTKDFCDLSIFGLDSGTSKKDAEKISHSQVMEIIKDTKDFCDLSVFGLDISQTSKKDAKHISESKVVEIIKDTKDFCDLSIFGLGTPENTKKDTEILSNSKAMEIIQGSKDFCDLSVFGLDVPETPIKNNKDASPKHMKKHYIEDSNSGSEDLFGSCSNSPTIKNNTDANSKDSFEQALAVLDVENIDVSIRNSKTKSIKEPLRRQINFSNTMVNNVSDFEANEFISNSKEIPSKVNNNIAILTPLADRGKYKNQRGELDTKMNDKTPNKTVPQVSITQILSIIGMEKDVDQIQSNELNSISLKNKNNQQAKKLSFSDEYCFEELMPLTKTKATTQKQLPKSAKKKNDFAKRKRFISPSGSDSADEFEDSPFKSTGWIQPKRKMQCTSSRTSKETPKIVKSKKKKTKSSGSYVDHEAALASSDEAEFQDSESEGGSSEDAFEASFVNDETLDIANTTDMHAKYLRSTRSPLLNKGTFKIPPQPALQREIVFSQIENNQNDTYLNDTFCVGDDVTIDLTEDTNDLSELEKAELILKNERRSKKAFHKGKFKKIIISSDSD